MGEYVTPDPELTPLRMLRAEAVMPPEVGARIVRGSLRRLERRRRWRRALWVGVPCAVAAAALLLWMNRGPVRDGERSAAATESGRAAESAPPGSPATAPVAVHTGGEAGERVRLGDHQVELGPHARLEVTRAAGRAVELVLTAGRAEFTVAPLPPGEGFRVATEAALVEVVGTRFTVAREDGCTEVTVAEGVVRVSPAAAEAVELTAGDRRRDCVTPASATGGDGGAATLPGEGWVRTALTLVSSGREPERAMALLERYLARHERGVFAEDALFHLSLLYRDHGRLDDARRTARRFVERFPDSRRAQRLRRQVLSAP